MEPSITWPNCGSTVKLTETLAAPLIEKVRKDREQKLRQKEQDFARREEAIRGQEGALAKAREDPQSEIAGQLKLERKKVAEEEAKKARAAFDSGLQDKAREIEGVLETQAEIRLRAKMEAEGELGPKEQEREQTILVMQRQIEELKRKSEQGSQQLQGEVQELHLETGLRAAFPHDTITPVHKGEFGGDAIQEVTTPLGQPCGKILWESKRTKNWSDGWLQKLRDDQRLAKADAAILVSQTLPKSIGLFGQTGGVWITSPQCAVAVAIAVRLLLMEVSMARKAGEGQQSKMELMYQYLSGPRFRHRVEAIAEKFTDMQQDLGKERKAMQKIWAKREMQIRGVMESTAGMYGDLQGIAGRSLQEIEGFELDGTHMIAPEKDAASRTLALIEADAASG